MQICGMMRSRNLESFTALFPHLILFADNQKVGAGSSALVGNIDYTVTEGHNRSLSAIAAVRVVFGNASQRKRESMVVVVGYKVFQFVPHFVTVILHTPPPTQQNTIAGFFSNTSPLYIMNNSPD